MTWVERIFEATAVLKGDVVRRKIPDINRHVPGGLDELEEEVRRRNFHLLLTGEQAIIICNTGDLRILC